MSSGARSHRHLTVPSSLGMDDQIRAKKKAGVARNCDTFMLTRNETTPPEVGVIT